MTRERALEAAIAVADEQGLAAVSMRQVAGRLGVVPMALYKHVSSKEDLLAGMVDALVDHYDDDGGAGDGAANGAGAGELGAWTADVRRRVLSARRVLLAHPWARRAIEAQTVRTPRVLAHMDAVAGAFLRGGLSADLTHHAMHALGHRIWGFSPEAFDDPDPPNPSSPPPDPAELEAMREQLQRIYPHIAAITLDATDDDLSRVGTGCDEQFEFEFSLDLLLGAVDRLHRKGWRSPRRRTPQPTAMSTKRE